MAIVKHIKSRNANYSDALNYLIFQHDESTGKMILDEFNRPLRRDELYVDGLNCNPDTFDVECYECNEHFKKNRSRSEIKSHHYIISFDPDDKSECGLTGEKAQELCLNLAQKIFPGYQALIVTHTRVGQFHIAATFPPSGVLSFGFSSSTITTFCTSAVSFTSNSTSFATR